MRGGIPEVLVLGGGPAGCTAATLLTRWGHDVRLVTRPQARAVPLAESLTPSCRKLFDLLGVTDAVDAAGFVRSTGNTVWWGSDETRVEPFAGGARGWQATTTALERVLRQSAIDAGVDVEEHLLSPDAALALPAPVRLDCTGRAGLLARRCGGRCYEQGHRTVALTATWRSAVWRAPDSTHTLIESYADGWAWSVPVDGTRRAVAVMVDPQTTAMTRGEGAAHAYRAEIAKTRRFAALLAGAVMEGEPAGWDASLYASETYAGDGWLLVGDAASFIDPLSSAGVRKALGSGWLAAVATHTALTRPGMAETARSFYAAREAEVYATFRGLTKQFLSVAARGQSHPFWTDRADVDAASAVSSSGPGVDEVRAAYDRIRRAPELRLRMAPVVTTVLRPAISGAEIVMEPRLVTPEDEAGVRFLHDVDVVTLVSLAPAHRQVPDLYEACVRRSGPTDLPPFLTALATAVARGWLVEE